jgi:hypothetical protein
MSELFAKDCIGQKIKIDDFVLISGTGSQLELTKIIGIKDPKMYQNNIMVNDSKGNLVNKSSAMVMSVNDKPEYLLNAHTVNPIRNQSPSHKGDLGFLKALI